MSLIKRPGEKWGPDKNTELFLSVLTAAKASSSEMGLYSLSTLYATD